MISPYVNVAKKQSFPQLFGLILKSLCFPTYRKAKHFLNSCIGAGYSNEIQLRKLSPFISKL